MRGPAAAAAFGPDGAPTKAAEGFARGQGVAVADLVVREDGGREFVFAELRSEGRDVAEIVPDLAARLVNGLRFSKTMRWGDGTGLRFSRPMRWIVAKLDEQTVPFELHGLTAGDVSQGHRFLGGPAVIGDPVAYDEALRAVGVVPDHEARRAAIVAGLDQAAAAAGGAWSDPGGKMEEVVFLVEWPSVITGRFDDRHLRLPPRVLVTAMQGHQRYFPLRDSGGGLLPAFLAVSNGDPAHADVITRGNESVLDARLQDAEFSFDRDLEAGLEALDARLDAIVFHKRLGTMAQKRDRLVAGVTDLSELLLIDAGRRSRAEKAASLAKVDQGAILVAEFSELEGYVGAEYARREGVPEEVAQAIEDHYLPEGPDSPLPRNEVGALVAAAEKLDNLVGAFAVDEAPTGSKDPYGLRRAALGLVRIAVERSWDLDVSALTAHSYEQFERQGAEVVVDATTTGEKVAAFVWDRWTYLLGLEGVGLEAAAAAIGARVGGVDGTTLWARAIDAHRQDADFAGDMDRVHTPVATRPEERRHGSIRRGWRTLARRRWGTPSRPHGSPSRAHAGRRDFLGGSRRGRAAGRGGRQVLRGRPGERRRPRGAGAALRAGAGGGGDAVARGGLRAGHRRRRGAVSSTQVGVKRVYDFAEGSREMRDLLGGKGANVAEMTRLGLPVPKGFTITTETCIDVPEGRPRLPGGPRRGGQRAPGRARGGGRQEARRRREPAAGLGAQRRQVLDARDDGHGPQPRPQRPQRRGPRAPAPATRASPTTRTGASSRCSATWSPRSTRSTSRRRSRR